MTKSYRRDVLDKFTPLDPARITAIAERLNGTDFKYNDQYIAAVKEAKSKIKDYPQLANLDLTNIAEINNHLPTILQFLSQCYLIADKSDEYNTSAEALAIIAEIHRTKPVNVSVSDKVIVVKNCNDDTKDVIRDQKFIHESLAIQLFCDLSKAKQNDFIQSYVVEIDGSTDCNHIICLTVTKPKDSTEPVIELFDSSPALIRRGIDGCQDSFAGSRHHGIPTTLATIHKTFSRLGLTLKPENFLHNIEPMQNFGYRYCGSFAIQHAFSAMNLARQVGIERYVDILHQQYLYDSPFAGMCEVKDITFNERNKVVAKLSLQSPEVALSQFSSHFNDDRPSLHGSHRRKSQEEETHLQHRARYLRENQRYGDGSILVNSLAEQQSLRARVHLFEIIRSATQEQYRKRAREDYLTSESESFKDETENFDKNNNDSNSSTTTKYSESELRLIEILKHDEALDDMNLSYNKTRGGYFVMCGYMGAISAARVKQFSKKLNSRIAAFEPSCDDIRKTSEVKCWVEKFQELGCDFGILVNDNFFQRTKVVMLIPNDGNFIDALKTNSERIYDEITNEPITTVTIEEYVSLLTPAKSRSAI